MRLVTLLALTLELRVDRGPQFIARRFKTAARALGVEIAFCGVRASNDKPFIEAFFAVVEQELLAREPSALDSLEAFQLSFTRFIDFYHNERPIGTAGYRTPRELGEPDRIATTPVPEVTLIPCPA
jgi:transposase InsO family protein